MKTEAKNLPYKNTNGEIIFTAEQFDKAFSSAICMLKECEGLEIRSALKQAASDAGISEGKNLQWFVILAEDKMGLS